MFNLKLSESETEKLELDNAVYCFRGKTLYLVEKEGYNNEYKVTIFNAPVCVTKSKTYQTSIKY